MPRDPLMRDEIEESIIKENQRGSIQLKPFGYYLRMVSYLFMVIGALMLLIIGFVRGLDRMSMIILGSSVAIALAITFALPDLRKRWPSSFMSALLIELFILQLLGFLHYYEWIESGSVAAFSVLISYLIAFALPFAVFVLLFYKLAGKVNMLILAALSMISAGMVFAFVSLPLGNLLSNNQGVTSVLFDIIIGATAVYHAIYLMSKE